MTKIEIMDKCKIEREVHQKLVDHEQPVELTIHGLPDLLSSTRWQSKLLWSSVLVFSVGMTCYQIYRVILDFYENPTATQMRLVAKEYYQAPNLTICPKCWLNESKAWDLGLSEHGIIYLLTHLETYMLDSEIQHHITLNNISLHQGELELKELEESIPAPFIANLFLILAIHPSSFFLDLDPTYTVQPVLSKYGVCYLVQFPRAETRTMQASKTEVLTISTGVEDKFLIDLHSESSIYNNLYSLFVGTTAHDWTLLDPFIMNKGLLYQLKVHEQKTFRVNSRKFRCLESSSHSRETCKGECYESVLVPCLNFSFDIFSPANNLSQLFNFKVWKENKDHYYVCMSLLEDQLTQCMAECLDPCHTTSYPSSLITSSIIDLSDNISMLFVSSSNPMFYNEFKEVDAYTWITLISNVGGQLGLWLGCSVVSLVQVVYLVTVQLGKKIKFN